MKRFICVLGGLLVLPAFAEVAPIDYNGVAEYADGAVDTENSVESTGQKDSGQRATINRSTSVTRAISSAPNTAARSNTASRAVASSARTTTPETSRGTVARTTKTTGVTARTPSVGTNASRTAVSSRNALGTRPVTSRVGVYNNVAPGEKVSGDSVALTDYGPSITGASRVGVANRRASARIATPITPVTTTATVTQEDVTSTTSNLTNVAELTEYCKVQYAACMDNYCNILDDNQGRCSCSKNIKNYEKSEQTLAQATEDFQNVVQQIRYIGLTSDQIEALFTETEAELSMKSTTDSSRLKNNLDNIKKKIVDVTTPSATSTVTSGLSLDMNGLLTADFTAGFDLNSFLNMNNNSSSVSNQRGEQLYKTAANRCKTAVLNSCTTQGIDANIITNAYDLEIDKQCVLYERSLNDANAEMKQNAMNATTILQQARLLLAQNKNSYDLRGCVAAIDSCMQDEYICGTDYELCLDPTGKYLANGEIIKGGTPGVSGGQPKTKDTMCATACGSYDDLSLGSSYHNDDGGLITNYDVAFGEDTTLCKDCTPKACWATDGMYNLYSVWDYDGVTKSSDCDPGSGQKDTTATKSNAWGMGENETLGKYVDTYLSKWKSDYKKSKDNTYTDNMALFLLQKIGYIDDNDKVHGLCASVMKQCQDYAYSTSSSRKATKKYVPDNEVVRQYLNNTLGKIKMQQDAIIADYAEGCRNDVTSCLSTNGYDETAPNSTATKTAINACAAEITTCMSVGGYQITDGVKLTLRAMSDWVASIMLTCRENQYLADDGAGHVYCESCPSFVVMVDAGIVELSFGGDLVPNPNKPYVSVRVADFTGYKDVDDSKSIAVQGVSAGGRVSECSCPEGYTDFYVIGDYAHDPELKKGDHACIDTSVKCSVGAAGCKRGDNQFDVDGCKCKTIGQ